MSCIGGCSRAVVSFTYGILAGIGIFCCYRIKQNYEGWVWIYASYGFIILNAISKMLYDGTEHMSIRSITGCDKNRRERRRERRVCRDRSQPPSTNPSRTVTCPRNQPRRWCARGAVIINSTFWTKLHDSTYYMNSLYALPGLVSQFLLNNEICWRYSLIPVALTVFPLMVYLIDNVRDNSMLDTLIIGNVIFLSAFSTHYGNEYGVVAAIVYCVTHFILRIHRLEDCSKELLYNCGVAIYCILGLCTLNALSAGEDIACYDYEDMDDDY